MEVLKNFGFEPILFIAQIVNFLIVLYLLKKFLYQPVLETLKKRKDLISQGLQGADEGKKLLENAQLKKKDILKNAQEESRKLLDQAKKQALLVLEQTQVEAKIQGENIIQEAKKQMQEEAKLIEERLTKQVSNLAVAFLQKSISSIFSAKEQSEVLSKAVKKLKEQSNSN